MFGTQAQEQSWPGPGGERAQRNRSLTRPMFGTTISATRKTSTVLKPPYCQAARTAASRAVRSAVKWDVGFETRKVAFRAP
jgi:hypothetical protein